ncbi:RNA-directed DNA polymerase, eukaryota [Tanacetum coccineum]
MEYLFVPLTKISYTELQFKTSVLVNGSPTQKFSFQQGLRQGDPLSPFLFLLVMESLHISFVGAMEAWFFKGIQVGSFESSHMSHLFYADDAVFIGEWKEDNLRHLVCILQCFYLASGLRINIHKCSLMGVGGVQFDEVSRGATLIGCDASKLPFKYLGVMVGGKMARIHSWDLIIDKVVARMSKWKAKTLSIGGRFYLTKSALSTIPLYYFSIFKVPQGVLKCLESHRSSFLRGVAPGHRKATWFKSQPEALWMSVVKAIHGPSGNLDRDISVGKLSTWIDCICSMRHLKEKGVDLYSCLNKKVGNGNASLFWLENWMGDGPLNEKYPRLFALEENKEITVRLKVQNGMLYDQDTWSWSLGGVSSFSVASARRYIDDGLCLVDGSPTRWVKLVPIKVGVETTYHLFFSCPVTSAIVDRVLVWWGFPCIDFSMYHDLLSWIEDLKLRKEVKDYVEGTMFVAWWIIWSYRNKLIFSSDAPTKACLFDLIVYHSYVWCNARAKRNLDWLGWLKCPLTALM